MLSVHMLDGFSGRAPYLANEAGLRDYMESRPHGTLLTTQQQQEDGLDNRIWMEQAMCDRFYYLQVIKSIKNVAGCRDTRTAKSKETS